jgi:hypothetical protein
MSLCVLCLLCAVFAAKQQSSLRTIRTTVVVTTTNLNGQTGAQGNGNILQLSAEGVLTERFTRVAVDTIQYDVTSTTRRHGRARGRPRFRFTGSRVRDVRVRLSRGKLRTDILSASRADERAKEK